MNSDLYFFGVDATGHLALASVVSVGTVVMAPTPRSSTTAQPDSAFHTTYQVVGSNQPAAPMYATVGHRDFPTIGLEAAVAGLCIVVVAEQTRRSRATKPVKPP